MVTEKDTRGYKILFIVVLALLAVYAMYIARTLVMPMFTLKDTVCPNVVGVYFGNDDHVLFFIPRKDTFTGEVFSFPGNQEIEFNKYLQYKAGTIIDATNFRGFLSEFEKDDFKSFELPVSLQAFMASDANPTESYVLVPCNEEATVWTIMPYSEASVLMTVFTVINSVESYRAGLPYMTVCIIICLMFICAVTYILTAGSKVSAKESCSIKDIATQDLTKEN